MFNKKSDKSSSDGKRQKVFLVMLLLLHVVVVVCTVENLQIHSKRAWHIQGDAFFPIVVVVVATCTMMYEQKKTHSIKYKIQTYSRIQTYVLCQQCEHHTKACFCSTKSQAKKNNIHHSIRLIRWQFHIQLTDVFLLLFCLFHAWMCIWIVCVCVHCFKRHCVLKMEFQSVTTILSRNLWQCHC